jgi:hypothetical protein
VSSQRSVRSTGRRGHRGHIQLKRARDEDVRRLVSDVEQPIGVPADAPLP